MKTAFVIGLALMLGLMLAPGLVLAADVFSPTVGRSPADQWSHWPPQQHPQFRQDFRQGPPVIVAPPGSVVGPRFVWVPGQWAWTGWRWVWMQGYWQPF